MMFLLVAFVSVALPATKTYPATFIGCYDGDTCTFDLVLDERDIQFPIGLTEHIVVTKHNQHVRLCDINAPEMKPGPNAAAIKARDDLVHWITVAKSIEVHVAQHQPCPGDGTCDMFEKYGRLLAYIVADGNNLNDQQVTVGNAKPYIQCK